MLMGENEKEGEDEGEENGKQPELKTRKDLLDYAKQKYEWDAIIDEIGTEITPENFNKKLSLITAKIQQTKHWADQYYARIQDDRENKLKEFKRLDGYEMNRLAPVEDYDKFEEQAWENYSAIQAFETAFIWRMFALFYNSYAKEHEKKKDMDEPAKEMLRKSIATTLAFAKEYGVEEAALDIMVKENLEKLNADRRAAFEQEDARVKEIQDANLKYIRTHKNEKGEVKWNELWEKVGAHFTRADWENAMKKQQCLRIRRERHGSRTHRFVSEILGAAGESSDVGSDERH